MPTDGPLADEQVRAALLVRAALGDKGQDVTPARTQPERIPLGLPRPREPPTDGAVRRPAPARPGTTVRCRARRSPARASAAPLAPPSSRVPVPNPATAPPAEPAAAPARAPTASASTVGSAGRSRTGISVRAASSCN